MPRCPVPVHGEWFDNNKKITFYQCVVQSHLRDVISCPPDLPEDDFKTILVVTQLSIDHRLWLVEETCSRWTDPLVAVLYFADETASAKLPSSFILCTESKSPKCSWVFVVNNTVKKNIFSLQLWDPSSVTSENATTFWLDSFSTRCRKNSPVVRWSFFYVGITKWGSKDCWTCRSSEEQTSSRGKFKKGLRLETVCKRWLTKRCFIRT